MSIRSMIFFRSLATLMLAGLLCVFELHGQEFRIMASGDQTSIYSGDTPLLLDSKIQFSNAHVDYKGKLGSFKVKEGAIPSDGMKEITAEWNIDSDNGSLVVTIASKNPKVTITVLEFKVAKGVRFFGGGEQFSHVELTGKKVPFLVEENGIGRGDRPVTGIANIVGAGGHEFSSYLPIPLVMSTENFAYLIENDCFSEVDLSQEGKIRLKVHDSKIKLRVWKADSPKDLITKVTAHIGRIPILPDWTYGTILGIQGGADEVRQRVKDAQSFGNPISAIWIQDWVGKKKTPIGSRLHWEWQPDTLTYPNFKAFCQEMHAAGIKVMGYINPFLLEGTAMTNEALERKLIIHHIDGTPYQVPFGGFNGYILDLTNPETRIWIKSIIAKNMIGNGLSGWMADFAEWMPFDGKLHSGIAPKDYHNRFAAEWAVVNREAIEEAGKEGEVVFFSRSGWTGSSGISTLFWAGDQMVSFQPNDGLPSAINAMLSSGLSGIAVNHSDIGGYTAINYPIFKKYLRNKELLFRWIEFEAFTPIFRTHEGLLPKDMTQYYSDNETQQFFARFAKIHLELKPYFQTLIQEAAETGIPVIRHPWMVHPNDPECLNTGYQFFVGDDLLVMPVTEKGATTVSGYFPAGEWIHLFYGNTFLGNRWQEIRAPFGVPAVFLRKGAAIGLKPGLLAN